MEKYIIKPIAHVESDYNEKFGIPRQSGLVPELRQRIVFEPEFANADALRGIEDFSHLWIIWGFSENIVDMDREEIEWSPTVRPPRLGGAERKGVWATRSPYRPNSLGLSCVKFEAVESKHHDILIIVSGGDMLNGSPVYDIKPYIPYADCHPEASGGFTDNPFSVDEKGDIHLSVAPDEQDLGYDRLEVVFPDELLGKIPTEKQEGLIKILLLDPRGAYERRPGYNYGLSFGDHDVKFTVEGDVLTVTAITEK